MKIDGFFLAMACAVGLALLAPGVGAAGGPIPFGLITEIGIGVVFFLHGANLSRQALQVGATNWRLHLFVQSSTFILFPLIGALILVLSRGWLPSEMGLGVFFLCVLCSTISSSVAMVSIARGDVAAAVFNASLSGVIGMVVTPIFMSLVYSGPAGQLPILPTIADIALKLLAPFLAGHLLRPLIVSALAGWKPWINKLDRSVIVLIVYTAFCDSTKGGVWSRYDAGALLAVFVLVGLLLLLVLTATTFASRRLGFPIEDEITAVFCGSKKSLANGAPIAKILFGANPLLGSILLPLMIYHQLQLIVCAFLARRYAARNEVLPPNGAPARPS